MKTWIISENEIDNYYLIAKENSIWLTEQPKLTNLRELIDHKKLTNVSVHRYSNIKEIVFNDSDLTLEVEFIDDDTEDLELKFKASLVYENVKSFLIENLKEIVVKNYSLIKQLKPTSIAILVISALTFFLYKIAISLQSGEEIRATGRRGFIKKIFVAIADFLGPIGSLTIGGILLSLLFFGFINTVRKPKQGKVIKIKKNTELIF
ncbi:hypothetical protein [Tenacibaculum haliotis]|uniref:hypothetical protein n=1 Tax=Tenacibaculum haliotis TaxID=1888914 RepID=UPI0021AE6CC5|nr:hypothetical protein [Tenacibaculum haliotis]MCT4700229.1 hypothetical protein [Tenacibaculum haliotis]